MGFVINKDIGSNEELNKHSKIGLIKGLHAFIVFLFLLFLLILLVFVEGKSVNEVVI